MKIDAYQNGTLQIGVGPDYEVLLAPSELPDDQLDLNNITGRGFRLIEAKSGVNVHGHQMSIRLFTAVNPVTIQHQKVQAGGVLLRTGTMHGFEIIIGIEKCVVALFDHRVIPFDGGFLDPKDYQTALQPLLRARWGKASEVEFKFRRTNWRAALLRFNSDESADADEFAGLRLLLGPSRLMSLPPRVDGLQIWQLEQPQEHGRVWHHGGIFQIDGQTMLVCVGNNEYAQTDLKLLQYLGERGWHRVTSRDRHEDITGYMRTYLLRRGGQGRIDDDALQVFDLYTPFNLVGEMAVIEGMGALVFLAPLQPIQGMNEIAGEVERRTGVSCHIYGPASVMMDGNGSVECYRLILDSQEEESSGPEGHRRLVSVFQTSAETVAA